MYFVRHWDTTLRPCSASWVGYPGVSVIEAFSRIHSSTPLFFSALDWSTERRGGECMEWQVPRVVNCFLSSKLQTLAVLFLRVDSNDRHAGRRSPSLSARGGASRVHDGRSVGRLAIKAATVRLAVNTVRRRTIQTTINSTGRSRGFPSRPTVSIVGRPTWKTNSGRQPWIICRAAECKWSGRVRWLSTAAAHRVPAGQRWPSVTHWLGHSLIITSLTTGRPPSQTDAAAR